MSENVSISGAGMAVPELRLHNDELSRFVETSDEWIWKRTGIASRALARGEETTASLAALAGCRALEAAGVEPSSIGLVVVATTTPDHALPSTACLVQDALGIPPCPAFDLAAACTGYVYAAAVADSMMRTGGIGRALVIGADCMSRIIDWSDRATCVLFGDGAGATVLSLESGEGPAGFLAHRLSADGSGADMLYAVTAYRDTFPEGEAPRPAFSGEKDGLMYMNGAKTFRLAVRYMAAACREAAEASGTPLEDVDLIVPHQANERIMAAVAKELGLPATRVLSDIAERGNTSAASIPIALSEALADGRLGPGSTALLVGFGGGMTWGSSLHRWTG